MACAYSAGPLFPQCNEEHYACFCKNDTFVETVSRCIATQADHNSTIMGAAYDKFVVKFCEIHNVKIVEDIEDAATLNTNGTRFTIDGNAYLRAYEAEENYMTQKETSMWLGLGLIFYWTLIAILAFAYNAVEYLSCRYLAYPRVMRKLNLVDRLFRQHVMWPSTITKRHMTRFEFFRGFLTINVPLRHEFIFAFGYAALVMIFMLTPYVFMDGDVLYPSKWKQMMRYASDRAGIMATVQFPMLYLFAAKNNILIYFTRWSYMKCSVFHRTVAVVTYALFIIHAAMKHIFSKSYGGSLTKYYYPVPYFRWGCAAMGLMALMIALAPLRSRLYSIFYRLHQSLAAGTLVCSIMHLQNLPFRTPLYIACGIWGFDWILRFLRLWGFNYLLPFITPLAESRQSTFAIARLYDNETISLSVRFPIKWRCGPGEYVFVHFYGMNISGGHPFSVVGPTADGNGLKLLITPRRGTTQTLLRRLKNQNCSQHNPVSINVWVEGPYGLAIPVERYDIGLFFCGGIGITGMLGYIDRMSQKDSRITPRKVVLLWAVKSPKDITSVKSYLVQYKLRDGVEIRIFCRSMGGEKQEAPTPLVGDTPNPKRSDTNLETMDKVYATISEHTTTSSTASSDDHNQARHDTLPTGASISFEPATYDPDHEALELGRPVSVPLPTRPRTSSRVRRLSSALVHEAQRLRPKSDLPAHPLHASRPISVALKDKLTRFSTLVMAEDSETDKFDYGVATTPEASFKDDLESLNLIRQFRTNSEVVNDLIEPVGMDIPLLLKQYFSASSGSICVAGCGPDRMMDALRWGCGENLPLARNGIVDYFEEAMRW